MIPAPPGMDRERDLVVKRAHLLCVRGKYDQAERLLLQSKRRFGSHPDLDDLLGRIAATRHRDKNDENRVRQWRYSLGLNAGWRRFCWGAAAAVAILYGTYNLGVAVREGTQSGFSTLKTTQVYQGGGRYRSGRWVSYTRPIYYDALYGSGIALVGAVGMMVLFWASQGAALWEELDDSYSQPNSWV